MAVPDTLPPGDLGGAVNQERMAWGFLIALGVLAAIAVDGVIIYVAFHFISKFW